MCDKNQLRLALKNKGTCHGTLYLGSALENQGKAWLHPEEIKSLVRALFHPPSLS